MTVLGKAPASVVKLLIDEIPKQALDTTPDAEIQLFNNLPEFCIDEPSCSSPTFLGCRVAYPHIDWSSYFVGISLIGERELGEKRDGKPQTHTWLEPGTIFVVDGDELHWLVNQSTDVPDGWWVCLQWELQKSNDVETNRNALQQILAILGPATPTPPGTLAHSDDRYAAWLKE